MSYPLVESLPYTSQDYNFQQGPHPMASQVVTVDKLYGYGALTHGHQKSNNSGYFNINTGYGNDKLNVGYDKACASGQMNRDILGRVTISNPRLSPQSQNCGCTQYVNRNCTGTMGNAECSESKPCSASNPLCCYSGDMCSQRQAGDTGTCIAGQPLAYLDQKSIFAQTGAPRR